MVLPKVNLSKNANIMVAIMGLVGIFGILIAFFGIGWFQLSIGYEGGWECRTSLNQVYIASQNKWYTQSTVPFGDIPWGPKGVRFDPTSSTDYPNWNFVHEPDININVDDPIHTKEDSDHELIKDANDRVIQAPLEEYVREIKTERGTETFFYYHHVYATMVTVKTQSDRQDLGYLWQSNLETAGEEGIPLVFTIRFEFMVEPWNIVGESVTDENGDEFTVTTAFAGIMAASYEVVDAGFNDRVMQATFTEQGASAVLATVTTGWTIIKPEEHSACNMYKVDGSTASNTVPTDPSTITGVPNRVYIDVSGTLQAGASQPWLALANPYDLFMQFTVRIDVLSAAGFTPVTGTDPLAMPPDDIVAGPVPFYYPLAYALGQIWADYWWMVVIVVAVVFLILVLIVLSRLRALFRRK